MGKRKFAPPVVLVGILSGAPPAAAPSNDRDDDPGGIKVCKSRKDTNV
jgi:hypothetical protein